MCKYIDISSLEYSLLDSRIGCYRIISEIRIVFVKDGLIHREKGPAIIWQDGIEEFYMSNKLHREDGPAVISSDKTIVYSLNGKTYSEEEYLKRLSKKMLKKFLTNKDNF